MEKFVRGDHKKEEIGEELTRSPYVNELIKISKDVIAGHLDKEELREPINKLYDTYDTLLAAFKALMPTQPKTEVSERRAKILLASFESFRCALDEITLYFRDEDPEHIIRGIKELKEETETIMRLSDEFQKEEEQVPRYSYSPLINELIRIGKGVADGDFKPEFLKTRFEMVKDVYEETYANVKEISQAEPDSKELAEQTPVIMKGLELFKEGLDDIQNYFDYIEIIKEEVEEAEEEEKKEKIKEKEKESVEILKKGLEKIEKASMQIYEVQMALKSDLDKKQKRLCFRCGYEVPMHFKFCPECRARLPELLPAESTVEISDYFAQEQVMVPANVKKVYNSAWAVAKGKITKKEFENTLDWFENNINENQTKMKELFKTPKNITKEEEKLFESIKKNVEEGVKGCLAGVEEMRIYLKDNNITHLEIGLGKLMKGGDQLYGVRQIIEKAIKSQKK